MRIFIRKTERASLGNEWTISASFITIALSHVPFKWKAYEAIGKQFEWLKVTSTRLRIGNDAFDGGWYVVVHVNGIIVCADDGDLLSYDFHTNSLLCQWAGITFEIIVIINRSKYENGVIAQKSLNGVALCLFFLRPNCQFLLIRNRIYSLMHAQKVCSDAIVVQTD